RESRRRAAAAPDTSAGARAAGSSLARQHDDTRTTRADGAPVEVPPERLDPESGALEHLGELVRRVAADALPERAGRSPATDLDSLLHAAGLLIPPPANLVLAVGGREALLRDEARERVVEREGVAENPAARGQDPLDLGHDREVIRLREEVAEAREEVDDRVEAASPEGQAPHVGANEPDSGAALPGELELGEGVVEADGGNTLPGEPGRVAAGTAAEIQKGRRIGPEPREREGDFPPRRL